MLKKNNFKGITFLVLAISLIIINSGFSSLDFYRVDNSDNLYFHSNDLITKVFLEIVDQSPVKFNIDRINNINILTMSRFVQKVSPVVVSEESSNQFVKALYMFTGELIGELESKTINPGHLYYSYDSLENCIKNRADEKVISNSVMSRMVEKEKLADNDTKNNERKVKINIKESVVPPKIELKKIEKKMVIKKIKTTKVAANVVKKKKIRKIKKMSIAKNVDKKRKKILLKKKKIEKRRMKIAKREEIIKKKTLSKIKTIVVSKKISDKIEKEDLELKNFTSFVDFENRGDSIINSLSIDYSFLLE